MRHLCSHTTHSRHLQKEKAEQLQRTETEERKEYKCLNEKFLLKLHEDDLLPRLLSLPLSSRPGLFDQLLDQRDVAPAVSGLQIILI